MNKITKYGRRDFLRSTAGAALLLSPGLVRGERRNEVRKKPNIVLIVSDDHGLDALGCYGNNVVKTPHLDELAAGGVRFTQAFCTTASCSPSRSVILTGLHNHANGMYGLQHTYHHFQSFDNIQSLPVFLSAAGYRTVRAGKFHLAPESVYHFDLALSQGTANDMKALGRSPVEMADACRDFLALKDDVPFFLYFCTDDPHRGLPFDTWPGPNPFGNREEGYPGVESIEYDPAKVLVPAFLPDSHACRTELAQYYQSVSRADQGVGRLVRVLKETGQYDNTVILYISDNGIAFPGAKTTLYDAGIHLPCILRTPWGGKRGGTCDAMISWTDITPTILDMAGATPDKAQFHGRSFLPAIDERDPQGWDAVYASHTFHEVTMYYPMRAIRTEEYKLIRNLAHSRPFPFAHDLLESTTWKANIRSGSDKYGKRPLDAFLGRSEFELYDLKNDPDEVKNLAYQPEYEQVLKELKTKLNDFQAKTGDPWRSE